MDDIFFQVVKASSNAPFAEIWHIHAVEIETAQSINTTEINVNIAD